MGTGHRVVKFVSGMRTLILRKLKTRKYDVRVNVVQRDTDGGRYIVTVERGNTGGLHSAQRTPENPPRCMCRCPDIFGALRLMYVPVRTFSAPQISSSVCQNPDIFDTQIKVCVGVRTF